MATLDQRIKFAEKHIKDKTGRPWSAKGRQWIIDEFLRPLDGYKLWPVEPERLCESCSSKVSSIVDEQEPVKCRKKAIKGGKCAGLSAEPIIMTVLCLPRRSGKTFNVMSWALTNLFLEKNRRIAYIASSENQMLSLFSENYLETIERDPVLSRMSEVRRSSGIIRVKNTKSIFEGLSTSHGAVTGRGRTAVIVDEARDVPPRTMMSLLPSTFEQEGWECPYGHLHTSGDENVPAKCPACQTKLRKWYGRILIMSSAGMLEGGEKDWFSDLVEHLRANPTPNSHLFEATKSVNPDISKKVKGTVEDIFGSLDSTRAYVAAEVDNEFTRKGENFLSKKQIDQCIDRGLRNKIESHRPCVAFLDTSKTVDKTSLVILADDEERSIEPWGHTVVERIDVWEPKKLPGGVINPQAILEHLDLYLPLYPNLRALRVDTRVMPWAIALVKKIRKERAWGKVVDGWSGKRHERKASWTILHQRILSCTLRMPLHAELRQELLSVRRVDDIDGRMDIRDANRFKRHVDIAESLATACYLAHLESMITRQSLSGTVGQLGTKALLSKLYKPQTSKIDLGKF